MGYRISFSINAFSKVVLLRKDFGKFIRQCSVTRRGLERILGKWQFASIVDLIRKARLKRLNCFFRSFARKGLRDVQRKAPQSLMLVLR